MRNEETTRMSGGIKHPSRSDSCWSPHSSCDCKYKTERAQYHLSMVTFMTPKYAPHPHTKAWVDYPDVRRYTPTPCVKQVIG